MISFTSIWLCLPALWMCSVDVLRLYFSSVLLPSAVALVSRRPAALLACSGVSSRSCMCPTRSEWRRKYAGWQSSSVHSGIVRPTIYL
ncbi:hypothetical protein BJ912DRAFT_951351, partial [Pholiota molesta]